VSRLALGSLEWQYPPQQERPADVEAIVVLAGGVIPPDGARDRAKLDEESPGPTGAELMRAFLVQLGVRRGDLLVEDASRSTYENAVESTRLLREHHLRRVALVTDAVDLFRAVRCFRKQGVEPLPSASHYRAGRFEWSLVAFLPSPGALRGCRRVWHEWLGAGYYWLRGRI
jgi:uncharacterized SAM-binding protein YcdF (DUF218 family)